MVKRIDSSRHGAGQDGTLVDRRVAPGFSQADEHACYLKGDVFRSEPLGMGAGS